MTAEYWRWPESRWTAPDKDWTKAEIITAGVDVGSVSTQAVIMIDGELFAYSSMRTGSDSPESAQKGMNWALEGTGMKIEDIQYTVGTGYGRVNVPFANKAITEISCHARGAVYTYGPTVRTILDMGGQDCKVIRCDDKGAVKAFLMNDKCAAGTGRGMEAFADLVEVPIERVGPTSLEIDAEPPPVSNTCVVFAKAEAVGLFDRGWSVNRVLAAYCSAMTDRIVSLIQRLGSVEKDFVITGGIAKNIGIVKRLERELGVEALPATLDTQIAGALGAAIFARGLLLRSRQAA
jgi:bzd-type benzoyl-CoA reductase Q subunit